MCFFSLSSRPLPGAGHVTHRLLPVRPRLGKRLRLHRALNEQAVSRPPLGGPSDLLPMPEHIEPLMALKALAGQGLATGGRKLRGEVEPGERRLNPLVHSTVAVRSAEATP